MNQAETHKLKMNIFLRWAVVLMVGQALSYGADITPGYTFSSGEANVTHTKLNNSAAGTINTTFFSGKGSAGTDPNTAFTLLLHNTTLDSYQKMPISALLDHASLLSSRTAATAPAVDDLVLVYDASASAYRSMTWSNWLFGGTATSSPTNDTRFPVLHGGVPSSLTLSNLLGGLTSHALPTNGDALAVLTANGRAVKQMALESIVKDQTAATNWGNYQSVVWDGTRLRSAYETNKIDGLTSTNTAPATNDAFVVLQGGALKKLFMNELKDFIGGDVIPRHYAVIMESNANTTAAQTLTAASGWEVRTLNLEAVDTGGIVTLSANQFTLGTGTYRISITAPAFNCDNHQARLYNVTGGATWLIGSSATSSASGSVTTESRIVGRIAVVGSQTFQVEHNVSDNGTGGTPGSHGLGEIYTVVEIWKEIGD